MTARLLLDAVRSRVARIAVGGSTVRGRGHTGTARAARDFLRRLDLTPFGSSDASFLKALDSVTTSLRDAFPPAAQHWGLARKVLNIFLRDCLYTTYVNEAFHLGNAERSFELPLDSITAKELKGLTGRKGLPSWPGVIHVTPSISAAYQEAALAEAEKRGIARVHLDAIWWSVGRD